MDDAPGLYGHSKKNRFKIRPKIRILNPDNRTEFNVNRPFCERESHRALSAALIVSFKITTKKMHHKSLPYLTLDGTFCIFWCLWFALRGLSAIQIVLHNIFLVWPWTHYKTSDNRLNQRNYTHSKKEEFFQRFKEKLQNSFNLLYQRVY